MNETLIVITKHGRVLKIPISIIPRWNGKPIFTMDSVVTGIVIGGKK